VARHLDAIGFTVFAGCLDTASEGAQRLRVEAGPGLRLVNMDVRREEHIMAALRYMEENLPAGEQGLYAVVNNAGVCVCGEFDWQTWGQVGGRGVARWRKSHQVERQVEVNLLGSLRVTKLCLPLLKRCLGGGRVVNVSR
jgi:3-hydroxybutyrate dehydrogenase